MLADKAAGVWADTDRIHTDRPRRASTSRSAARSTCPAPPQGHPLIVQAGSSEDGKDFAARYAEAVFTAHQTLEDAQDFYARPESADRRRRP